MTYRITAKHCTIDDQTLRRIQQQADRVGTYLPRLSPELSDLDIVVTYTVKKGCYKGSMLLNLPRKLLYVRFTGETPEDALGQGFRLLRREVQTYKSTHFSADSSYPDHRSIRKGISV